MGSKKERKLKAQMKTPAKPAASPEKKSAGEAKKAPPAKISFAVASRPLYTIVFVILMIVILEFVFQFMLNTLVTDHYMKAHPEITDQVVIRNNVEEYKNGNPLFQALTQLITSISGILALMLVFGRAEKENLPEIGFSNPRFRGANIVIGLAISALAAFCAFALLSVFGYIEPTGALVFSWMQLLWIAVFAFTALFEEMFFHGYLVFKLGGKLKPLWIILITGALFALWGGLPNKNPIIYLTYMILGCFMCFARIKFDSLWFSIAFRFGWTVTSGVGLSIYTSQSVCPGLIEHGGIAENFLSGSNLLGFENGFIAVIILTMCFIAVYKISDSRQAKYQRKLVEGGYIR